MTVKQGNDGLKIETIAASQGIASDVAYGAVAPPLYLTSTYAFEGFEQPRRYAYGRGGNPNRDMLCDTLAQLEGGSGGVVTASGMAAFDLLLSQLEPEQRVLVPHDCYGGTLRLVKARSEKRQFCLSIIDMADDEALSHALEQNSALVLVETPSNPLMRVTDIARVVSFVRRHSAKLVVDNTFLSPAFQQPLSLGSDYVLHSTTKYLNGHSDVVGGALIAADATDADTLRKWANTTGVTGSPFDSWLTLRGLRTLVPRIERQAQTAGTIAEWLSDRPEISEVHYPGLKSHSGHEIAMRQQRGFGAMLSFELKGGLDVVRRFIAALDGIVLAESLGGIESLISHPATMTHASMDQAARQAAGINDGLLRLSVGLEHETDLLEELEKALNAIG